MATIEKVSDVYEGGKKVGEIYARGETAVEFRRSRICVFGREFTHGNYYTWVGAGSVPKLEAALKLWKRRADGFAAYWKHIVMAVGGGLRGYYYIKPHGDKETIIKLEELPGKKGLRARKVPRSVVDKIGDVRITKIYDVAIRGETVGEIYKLGSRLLAELRRFNVGIGRAQTKFGNIHMLPGRYERLDYGSAGISIRGWEVDDLLEIVQLWKTRRWGYPSGPAP